MYTMKEDITSDIGAGITSMAKVPILEYFTHRCPAAGQSCHHEGKGGQGDGPAGEKSCCISLETRV